METRSKRNQDEHVNTYYSNTASRFIDSQTETNDVRERSSAIAAKAGYDPTLLTAVPLDANLGLGCGNPHSIGHLAPGDRVLDIGSGGGLDCFIAAKTVGPSGYVIGVDMSPQMIELSRRNATKFEHNNVEFRLGKVEDLPIEPESIDVVISNCVINLVTDKELAYANIFNTLKQGGRLAISDTVVLDEFPPILDNGFAYRPIRLAEYENLLQNVGFSDVSVEKRGLSCFGYNTNDPVVQALTKVVDDPERLASLFASVYIRGIRK